MADDVAALGITVDSSSVKTGIEDLRNFNEIAKRTGETAEQVQARYKKLRDEESAALAQRKQLTTATEAANASAQRTLQANVASTKSANELTREVGALGRAFGILVSQADHAALQLGRLGQALITFGPTGLAIGAGLGLAVEAFRLLTDAAEELGKKAIDLKSFAVVTGLTTDQIQGLKEAAAEVGVASGVTQTFIDRLTINMVALREATGPLYDVLLKINPSLAQQAVNANSVTQVLNILARAYGQAGEKANLLLQAAGGRGGLVAAPLLGAINQAGGVEGIIAHAPEAITLSAQLVKNLAEAQATLNKIREQNFDIFARIFSQDVLDAEIAIQKGINEILLSFDKLNSGHKKTLANIFLEAIPYVNLINTAVKTIGTVGRLVSGPPTVNIAGQGGGRAAGEEAATATAQAVVNAQALANQQKALNAVLGAAATEQDKLLEKTLAINAAYVAGKFAEGGLSAAEAELNKNRAIGAARLESAIAIESKRNSALGDMATAEQVAKQKQDELRLAQTQGIAITNQQVAIISRQAAIQKNAADQQIRIQAGVATNAELVIQKQAELNLLVAKGKLSYDDIAKGAQGYAKALEDVANQQRVFRAALPGLQNLANEFGSLRTQLDQFSTSTANNIVTNLADITSGTVTAAEGFKNLANQVLRSLEEMVIKMAIVKPIVDALQVSLGGLVPGFGIGGGATGSPVGLPFQAHSGGVLGADSLPSRYVHPAYFENAPHFASGGMVGGEMPIIAHQGEGVFTPGQMRAMGGGGGSKTININSTYDIKGAVGKEELAETIKKSHDAAVQRAVSISSAAAPARQRNFDLLGT